MISFFSDPLYSRVFEQALPQLLALTFKNNTNMSRSQPTKKTAGQTPLFITPQIFQSFKERVVEIFTLIKLHRQESRPESSSNLGAAY